MPQTVAPRRFPYSPKHWQALKRTFSEPRLSLYTEYAAKGLNVQNVDEHAFYLCQWNTELCEAFYRPLCYLEVSLRNTLTPIIAKILDDKLWYESNPFEPDSFHYKQLDIQIRYFKYKTRSTYPIRKSPAYSILPAGLNVHNVTARLTLPFWIEFFDENCYPEIYEHYYTIFKKLPDDLRRLKQLLPEMEELGFRQARNAIFARLEEIKDLRNEVAHYGTIFEWPLQDVHNNIQQIVGWIDPDTAEILEQRTFFEEVWQRRKELLLP